MHFGIKLKRNMFRAFLIVSFFCISMLLSGCRDLFTGLGLGEKMPLHQLGTTWRSEDGKIEFTIVEVEIPEHEETHGGNVLLVKAYSMTLGVGTMLMPDGESIQIRYSDGRGGYVAIERMPDNLATPWDGPYSLVVLEATDVHDGYFVATVKNSTIYTPGDRIRFDRVEP